MSAERTDLLAFFETLFPEDIYLVPEPASRAAAVAETAVPLSVGATARSQSSALRHEEMPAAPGAPFQKASTPMSVSKRVTAEVEERPADVLASALHPTATAPDSTTPASASAATPAPAAGTAPASSISSAVAQQSKGDGTGAIIVQRLPKAVFAKLREDVFWEKFLAFLKLDWTTVRFVNVLTPEPLALDALRAEAPKATRMLLFGDNLVAPLPPTLPRYKVLEGKTMKVVLAHAVAELTDERKRELMQAMREF